VVVPRLPGARRATLSFFGIAAYDSGPSYAEHVQSLKRDALTRIKLEHCHIIAQVCETKYYWLRWSWKCGVGGLIATLTFIFLS
jgi:hypothetical protein